MQRRIRQLKGRFLLDVVIRQGSTIFDLLASENQSLLIRWNTLYFVLRLEGGKGEEDDEHNKRKRSAENPGSNKKTACRPITQLEWGVEFHFLELLSRHATGRPHGVATGRAIRSARYRASSSTRFRTRSRRTSPCRTRNAS